MQVQGRENDRQIVSAIKEIIKKDKSLRSLGPTKRPVILNKLKQRGYEVNTLKLTRIINTHLKK